jgi:hypothetical protein
MGNPFHEQSDMFGGGILAAALMTRQKASRLRNFLLTGVHIDSEKQLEV